MQPLSATEAIGPAFSHARTVLASRPFRLGHFFKLALVAAFTQATFFSICFTYPLQAIQYAAFRRPSHHGFVAPAAGVFAVIGLGVILGIAAILLLSLLYLYLACRARATLFDLVVLREGRVRQAWRRQRAATWRYFGVFLLATLLFWIVLAATLGPFLFGMVKTAMAHGSGPAALSAISSQLLIFVALIWLLLPLWIAIDAILQDFILPSLALDLRPGATTPRLDAITSPLDTRTPLDATTGPLEARTPIDATTSPLDTYVPLRTTTNPTLDTTTTTPLRLAFTRFANLLRRSPGQLLLFLILRTIVSIAIALALGLIAAVAFGILCLAFYGVGKALYTSLWPGSIAAHTVFFTALAAMTLILAVLYLLTVTAIYGVSGTFKTSYAALFYSNYYPDLAALLPQQETD
jgi:hypothetical protein